METASLFIQKVGVVLSGTMSHVIVSKKQEKLCLPRVGARILIKGKSTQSSRDVLILN